MVKQFFIFGIKNNRPLKIIGRFLILPDHLVGHTAHVISVVVVGI
jgi:hypothetical protein